MKNIVLISAVAFGFYMYTKSKKTPEAQTQRPLTDPSNSDIVDKVDDVINQGRKILSKGEQIWDDLNNNKVFNRNAFELSKDSNISLRNLNGIDVQF